ncbi:hypothetical protein BDV37DRAFT_275923 [Aspergillus pseudonomiae]|uniref:Protein kinase domain-containing protein n=1 Tax=Aspergillus pseudonomiae TaxID=1506151 RepID=A0A5N7CYK5_9EURO|nr:uncharacterized protein BDV37DRAFT_275923 [Aspergillus pseudonomiae]KAE8398628.1 hypothetical protein BDV37DRAFT_275923 [Aspergillus pseudonomiae]
MHHLTLVIKSAHHFRIHYERDVLRKFQLKTQHLRTLIDEIVEPSDPSAIAMKHVESDLLAPNPQSLVRRKMRHVSQRILEALKVLHEDGYMLTDIKVYNVLLADLESTVQITSSFCRDRVGIVPLECELKILSRYQTYFGPYPLSYADLTDQETLDILSLIMDDVPPVKFQQEITTEDKELILKIMKPDPRDRPAAK